VSLRQYPDEEGNKTIKKIPANSSAMDQARVKVVVFGSYHAGKSTFIQAIDQTSRHIDAESADGATTVALDFGKTDLFGRHIHLYGTPGQERFEFVREIIASGMDAAILLVDCSCNVDEFTRQLYHHLSETGVPFSVMLNKCDLTESCPSQIRSEFSGTRTYQISARHPESARDALAQFLQEVFSI
jgi:hypothetical protein